MVKKNCRNNIFWRFFFRIEIAFTKLFLQLLYNEEWRFLLNQGIQRPILPKKHSEKRDKSKWVKGIGFKGKIYENLVSVT